MEARSVTKGILSQSEEARLRNANNEMGKELAVSCLLILLRCECSNARLACNLFSFTSPLVTPRNLV